MVTAGFKNHWNWCIWNLLLDAQDYRRWDVVGESEKGQSSTDKKKSSLRASTEISGLFKEDFVEKCFQPFTLKENV